MLPQLSSCIQPHFARRFMPRMRAQISRIITRTLRTAISQPPHFPYNPFFWTQTLPGPPFFIHGGQEVVMDATGHVHCDPSVVERVFRPPRRSLSDHTMTAYIDAVETCLRVHGGIATPAAVNSVDFDDTDDGDDVAVSS